MGSIRNNTRSSNMELLRLVAMFLVMVTHAVHSSLGIPTSEEWFDCPLPTFSRMFVSQCSFVCVNVFVLISGWFGINPSLKGLSNLFFQLFFYSFLIYSYLIGLNRDIAIVDVFYSFIGGTYWFIVSYIGLYCIAPILNI